MAILHAVTTSGPVRGVCCQTEPITRFLGIPYAAAPVGNLRWKGPVSPAPWTDERLCGDYGYSCWQRDNTQSPQFLLDCQRNPVKPRPLRMSEDCLSLNIWTPAADASERLPVMVWFYGGGLQGGTTDDIVFDGEGLCSHGVLLVTVNYRTGVFGYFAHEALEAEDPHHASGNYGLRDQIFALQWIHDNIAAFGGDAGNVTIFGCSGGGRSVQGVACSPLSRGLVHHAVCHSAGGLNPDYSTDYAELKAQGQALMELCGCRTLDELRQVPANVLQKQYEDFGYWFNITGDGYALPLPMDEMVRQGRQADLDYLLCTMDDEFLLPLRGEVSLANFEDVRKTYRGRTRILGQVIQPTTDAEAVDAVVHAEAYEMKSAQLAWARVQAAQDKKPVRLSTFVHKMPGENGAAGHGDDQYYIFHTLFRIWRPFTAQDEALSQTLMRYWTNFAKTGDPNGEGLAPWTPYTLESPLTLTIDVDHCQMEDRSHPFLTQVSNAYIRG